MIGWPDHKEEPEMNDENEENLVFSFFFIAFAILVLAFVVVGMGLIIWSWL